MKHIRENCSSLFVYVHEHGKTRNCEQSIFLHSLLLYTKTFTQQKRALRLVDSWSRAPDQIQMYHDRDTILQLLPSQLFVCLFVDDGLFKLHIIAYKMKYNVFTINKIIYYNCS